MAPRKKAGPNIGSDVAVQVSNRAWHQFATAINDDIDIADRATLPEGQSLRLGLEWAIRLAINAEAGPTTREVKADLRRFVEMVVAAYRAMRPETRKLFNESSLGPPNCFIPDLANTTKSALTELREIERGPNLQRSFDEAFLSNVIWLVGQCSGIRLSLPSKAYYHRANEFPVYRSARVATEIACALAERHAPTAAPKLKRLRDCSQSTFVSKLLQARRRPALIRALWVDLKPRTLS